MMLLQIYNNLLIRTRDFANYFEISVQTFAIVCTGTIALMFVKKVAVSSVSSSKILVVTR